MNRDRNRKNTRTSAERSASDLEKVLKKLPGMERQVLELMYGLSGGHPQSRADIGARLRITPREVGEIAERGLSRLREVGDVRLMQKILKNISAAR